MGDLGMEVPGVSRKFMEPTYEYVKGQGWVLDLEPEFIIITMACGTKVKVYPRNPKPGEYWYSTRKINTKYIKDNGKLNLKSFSETLENLDWYTRYQREDTCDNEHYLYVTLEKL